MNKFHQTKLNGNIICIVFKTFPTQKGKHNSTQFVSVATATLQHKCSALCCLKSTFNRNNKRVLQSTTTSTIATTTSTRTTKTITHNKSNNNNTNISYTGFKLQQILRCSRYKNTNKFK